MTLDERIEALSQSVELLASMHKDHEHHFEEHRRRIASVIESLAETNRQITETNHQLAENDRQLTALMATTRQDQQDLRDAVMRLSVIAEAHQDTLDDHEKRLSDTDH